MNRDTLTPAAVVFGLFALTLLVVVAGHRDEFDQRSRSSVVFNPDLLQRTAELHRAASGVIPAHTAAAAISSGSSWSHAVERASFRLLFERDPARAIETVLSQGHFQRGNQSVRGLAEAADVVFGARLDALTDIELALYCDWVVNGQPGWSPDEIMNARQRLLARLKRLGVLDDAHHARLSRQPLVLRPTPIPID